MKSNMKPYRRKYLEAHGFEGPWDCDFCDDPVESLEVLMVHHRDHDRSNNDLSNLGGTHGLCHRRHHLKGVPKPPEHRAKISKSKTGLAFSDEHKANISKGKAGVKIQPHSDEHRRKISESMKRRRA